MNWYSEWLRPLLFRFDAEWCHDRAIGASEAAAGCRPLLSWLDAQYVVEDPRLATEVCGIRFPNPMGMAAGYDKNGRAIELLAALGFGHVEIGSVSADASQGNPRPRLFRLPQDRALIVHYGLPNEGAEAVASRLARKRLRVPLGINLVKTNRGLGAPCESDEAVIEDYVRSARALKDSGSYLCLNLSCPNTEHGRNFFAVPGNTRLLLRELSGLNIRCPVFLKVSPHGGVRAIETLLGEVEGLPMISGFAFNLSPGKPDNLETPMAVWQDKPGAVSGKPSEELLNRCIFEMYRRMDRPRYRILGMGGVFSAEDAYRKIRLGASLVQLCTALIYEGPGIVKRISLGLGDLLARDGFRQVADAVGSSEELEAG